MDSNNRTGHIEELRFAERLRLFVSSSSWTGPIAYCSKTEY